MTPGNAQIRAYRLVLRIQKTTFALTTWPENARVRRGLPILDDAMREARRLCQGHHDWVAMTKLETLVKMTRRIVLHRLAAWEKIADPCDPSREKSEQPCPSSGSTGDAPAFRAWYTVAEACERLGMTEPELLELVGKGGVGSLKTKAGLRVNAVDVEARRAPAE